MDMDGGVWETTVHGITKSQTQLSNFTLTFHFHRRTTAWETAPQIALRDCSKEERGKVGIYVILLKGQYMESSTCIF